MGSSRGQGHCVVFLGKTLFSQTASLRPGVEIGVLANIMQVAVEILQKLG